MANGTVITNDLFHLKVFGHLCHLEEFTIKGKEACEEDFGEGIDADEASAPLYFCGDRVFKRKPATEKVLVKYGITTDEYNRIADALGKELSFGPCDWCS